MPETVEMTRLEYEQLTKVVETALEYINLLQRDKNGTHAQVKLQQLVEAKHALKTNIHRLTNID